MTFKFGFTEAAIAVVVAFLLLAMLFLPEYDRPPLASVQSGYRGTGMAQIYNPRTVAANLPANEVPEIAGLPPLIEAGPKAGDVYQNVQVLTDLSAGQFLRLMTAITAWVSPEQGCAYCHAGNNFADDDLYTKRVSRWMIHMTRDLNTEWTNHVQQAWKEEEQPAAGVNCYTCHRGNNVPQNVWFNTPSVADEMQGMVGNRAGQNRPAENVALASLPANPFAPYLVADTDESGNILQKIRVIGQTALPTGNRASIKQAEQTYALMIHMSTSMGVNCTYCHNTRAMGSWEQSTPQRTTAWYGLQMVQALNAEYIIPSQVALPQHRLGPLGDVSKVNCATCHQGVFKPLYGANMTGDFPSLATANTVSRETLLPGLASAEASMEIGATLKSERTAAAAPAAAPSAPAATTTTTVPADATPAEAAPATAAPADAAAATAVPADAAATEAPADAAPATPAAPAEPATPEAATEAATPAPATQ
ncbi:photosynthetic reaction center cytochrome PufC [Acuticoccus sp. MNP-M23]|uniref:photosynthetic reaction center cytochrome PufC n=1 Tax=Acuticoccus sp. MNP-M23 TaxID=3072793 RepID=UPI0028153A05|nr:photosynthetic reaction center cytochrome PufC [Acuticoccus sp. MNP-M23]WMS42137.1 photosynthetic reaction center cytochrome PufC [Acuticoccus sp. MNP-M23]